jgi:type 1 glutamine amidotransferase
MTILATGKDSSGKAPTDRHEPVLMTVEYGQGRVFHTTMGHGETALEGVGFILSFTRGAEWAASGRVTQAIPKDFPRAEKSSQRAYPSLAEHAPKVKEKQ